MTQVVPRADVAAARGLAAEGDESGARRAAAASWTARVW